MLQQSINLQNDYSINDLLRLAYHEKASDLHISVDSPPVLRVNGELIRYGERLLTQSDTDKMAKEILGETNWEVFNRIGELDFSYYIEDVARTKDGLIQSFLDSVKEVAIDCVLNKNHNMLQQEYKCFQFDEPALFNKYVGPAYKEDIYDDMKIDNGSNSTKSMSVKIKVMKIKAVKLMSLPTENSDAEYSKTSDYWYYPKSGTVYDYDLHYQIGKIALDDSNIPLKLDKDVYIIDKLIPIPSIEQ